MTHVVPLKTSMPQVDEESKVLGGEGSEELFSDFTSALFKRTERKKLSERVELRPSDRHSSTILIPSAKQITSSPTQENAETASFPIIFGGLNTEKMMEFNWYFPYNNCENVINYMKSRMSAHAMNNSRQTKKKEKLKLPSTSIKTMASGLIHFTNIQKFLIQKKFTIKRKKESTWKRKLLKINTPLKK